MSVQFGRWNYDNAPPASGYLEKASQLLAPYGPDGEGRYSGPGVDIIYRGFHTTQESRRETQPHAAPSGAVITWDGRLDNREELIRQLSGGLSIESTDVAIVAAAYEKWGTDSFGKLVGDWALAIWNPRDQAFTLAKDFVGTRHLYYAIEKDQVTWSSILDPLVLLAGKSFALEEEYIAGWLGSFPATHLTPYVGIQAVPPSSFVRISGNRQAVRKYWDFDPGKRIRYRTDAEYEEHFRTVFAESVRRRLRSDTPVLAELSGGMDSSSIVCMADKIVAEGCAETPRLDTVSYYDDREPNWDERPYFSQVEGKRRQTGCHIDVATNDAFHFECETGRFAATPASVSRPSKAHTEFAASLASGGNRVILSGIGGDEVTGGVPTPVPELADHLATAQWRTLAHQLKAWALDTRKPWFQLFIESARKFLPFEVVGVPEYLRPAPWLHSLFVRHQRPALTGYPSRFRMFGPPPSFQENISTLRSLQRQLESSPLPAKPPHENRYPYVDRDLLEFIYAIPREQLVRPGQRRSLMRRAMIGIVPDAVLNRRRKAFVVRAPLTAVLGEWFSLVELGRSTVSASCGIIDQRLLHESLKAARHGEGISIVALVRILGVELWLRILADQEISRSGTGMKTTRFYHAQTAKALTTLLA